MQLVIHEDGCQWCILDMSILSSWLAFTWAPDVEARSAKDIINMLAESGEDERAAESKNNDIFRHPVGNAIAKLTGQKLDAATEPSKSLIVSECQQMYWGSGDYGLGHLQGTWKHGINTLTVKFHFQGC